MNQNRKKIFELNIKTINDGLSICSYIEENAKNLDFGVLLRALFSMILGALDTYLHGILEDKIISNAFDSSPDLTNDFDVNLSDVKKILNEPDINLRQEILRVHVRKRLEKYSFQAPATIDFVMNQLSIKNLWSKAAPILNMKSEDVKTMLALCVRRRNKISHESDWNPVIMAYDNISIKDVEDCRDFIIKFVDAIEQLT